MFIKRFPRIRHLCFMVGYKCNLSCSYCDLWRMSQETWLSKETVSRVCDEVLQAPTSVQITGGEPFLAPELHSILEFLHARYPTSKLIITTNGTQTEKIRDLLRLWGPCKQISISVSLNGALASGASSEHREGIERTLEMLAGEFPSVPRALKTVIGYFDAEELENAFAFAVAHGCRFHIKFLEHAVSYTNPVPSSLAYKFTSPSFLLDYTSSQKESLAKGLTDFIGKHGRSRYISFFDKLYIHRMVRATRSQQPPSFCCPAPGNFAMISPEGFIASCRYVPCRCRVDELGGKKLEKVLAERVKESGECPMPRRGCFSFWNYFL
ncbi:MAG: radical SAM protein [Candidatus Omnitrophota bacterium]